MKTRGKVRGQFLGELGKTSDRVVRAEVSEAALNDLLLERLHKAEILFKRTQKLAHVGTWEWDIRHDYVQWSDELCSILGLTPGNVPATYEAMQELVHPDDRELVRKALDKAFDTKQPYNLDHRILRPDGSVGFIHAAGNVTYDEVGQPIVILVVVSDVSGQKHAEAALHSLKEKYCSLIENANDAIVVVQDGIIKIANRKAAEISGYSMEHLIERHMSVVMRQEDAQMLTERHEKRLAGEDVAPVYPVRLINKQGKTRWFELKSADVTWQKKPTVLYFLSDITERRDAEQSLQALAAQVSLAEERERRRIALELHDSVGQSLALCSMKLGALRKSASSPSLSEELGEVKALIRKVIEETRSLTFDLSSPLLYEIGLEAALEHLVEKVGEQHGIVTSFEDDGKCKQLTDNVRVLIYQVVRELLINVVKHAHARHAKVSMTTEDDIMRFTIEDDGIGFDASMFNRPSKKMGGFGLFSVRERLRYVGGRINIESESGGGSRAVITLPVKQEVEA